MKFYLPETLSSWIFPEALSFWSFTFLKLYFSEALSLWSFIFLKLYLPGSFLKLYHSEALPFWSFIFLNLCLPESLSPWTFTFLFVYLIELPPITSVCDRRLSRSRWVVKSLSFTFLSEALSYWSFTFWATPHNFSPRQWAKSFEAGSQVAEPYLPF